MASNLLQKSGRFYGFRACYGTVFSVCVHGVCRKSGQLDAQGLVLNDGLLASD